MLPSPIADLESNQILAITNQGRMLFPVQDLPQLSKVKGNKIINIMRKQERERVCVTLDGYP